MPIEGFKDRIYHVEQETDEERKEREDKQAEEERVDRLRSTYGPMGRYYPGLSEKLWARQDAEGEARKKREQIKIVGQEEAI